MAAKRDIPKTYFGKPGKGVLAGGKRSKGKAPSAELRPDYAPALDDSTDVGRGERAAVRDFYLQHVGEDLDTKPDTQQALRDAGLLNPAAQRAKEQKGKTIYASAMDAIDAAAKAATGPLGRVLGAEAFGDYEKNPALLIYNPIAQARLAAKVAQSPAGLGVAAAVGKVAEPYARPVASRVPFPSPAAQVASVLRGEGYLSMGEAAGLGAKGLRESAPIVQKGVEAAPVPSPVAQVASVAAGKGYLSVGDITKTADRAARRPNDFIDTTRKKPIIIPDSTEQTKSVVDAAKSGASPAQIDLTVGDSNPFSPDAIGVMRNMARENGWDVTSWDQLSLGDKTFRAVNEKDNVGLFWRSLLRQTAEMAAAPASIPAIIEASADLLEGDPESAKQVFEAAISPYVSANETYKKRGFWPAAGEFIRDNPVDAITAFMGAAKAASRVLGAAARTGAAGERLAAFAARGRPITIPGREIEVVPRPFVETPLPEFVTPQNVGRASVREALAENRRIAAERAAITEQNRIASDVAAEQVRNYYTTGEMVPARTSPLVVGRAGKGLAGTVFSQYVRAPIISRFPRYRNLLEKRAAAREFRREGYNVAQGRGIEIEAALTRAVGEGASKEVKDRVAFNLSMPGFDGDGVPVTPAYVADFYRLELRDLNERLAAQGGRPVAEDLQLQTRLGNEIQRLDALERVEVPPEVMARARAEAKKIGELNEADMAAAMGVSAQEAKRMNLIRQVAMDKYAGKGVEAEAKRVQAERNAAIPELVRIQERLKRRAFAVQERARVTGWGKYGPKKSRKAFRKAADEMFADLRRGAELAAQNQNPELRSMFETAIADLSRGRLSTSDIDLMGQQLVADVRAMRLSAKQVRGLSTEARMQYEAALRLGEREAAAAAEAGGALAEAGLSRATIGNVEYARQRLSDAVDDLNAYESFPNPDPKVLARKQAVVAKEQKAYDLRSRALAAGQERAKLERQKRRRLDRVVMETGTGVMDTPEFRAVLDVSERFAVMEVKERKDLYYSIERAREEAVDAFIARLEANDANPVLHLVQTGDYQRIGRVSRFYGDRAVRRDPRAFMNQGRFESSEGYTFLTAQESGKYWDTLLRNTKDVRTAKVLQQRMSLLIEATSIPFKFDEDALLEARRMVDGDPEFQKIALESGDDAAFRAALGRILGDASAVGRADIDAGNWVVLNPDVPKVKKPSDRVSFGSARTVEEQDENLQVFMRRTLDARTADPNSPGTYYIMPRSTYEGIQKAIRDETYRIRRDNVLYYPDKITRLWRAITLNVLPRTAINNTIGSTMLAIMGGAGPRSMYYAWRAIQGKPVRLANGEKRVLPVPLELRQRYYEQMTDPLTNATGALAPIAHWMNSMRYINGMSEDLGRLALWYHKAYPTAMKDEQGILFFKSAKRLNDKSVEMLEAMAERDPRYLTLMDEYVQQSFDFLGDLHKGGPVSAAVRIAIPFWQWYAHMLKLTFFTMPFKYPKRALFLQMLSEIGRDYQERVGVSVPWGESFVPFMSEVVETPEGPQEVIGGVNIANWWPSATTSVLGNRQGEFGGVGFIEGSIAPIWSNTALIGASFLSILAGGNAMEFDDRKIIRDAADEYGLPIDRVRSGEFGSYVMNKAFRMFPLAPTIMSLSGRASNAFPIPGYLEERKYDTGQLPMEYRQQGRSDVASVVDDWRANLPGFLAKAVLGLPIQYLPGQGNQAALRYLREYQAQIRELDRKQQAVLEALLSRHGYDSEGKNR